MDETQVIEQWTPVSAHVSPAGLRDTRDKSNLSRLCIKSAPIFQRRISGHDGPLDNHADTAERRHGPAVDRSVPDEVAALQDSVYWESRGGGRNDECAPSRTLAHGGYCKLEKGVPHGRHDACHLRAA